MRQQRGMAQLLTILLTLLGVSAAKLITPSTPAVPTPANIIVPPVVIPPAAIPMVIPPVVVNPLPGQTVSPAKTEFKLETVPATAQPIVIPAQVLH